MQPYLFPYLGYYQLVYHCDKFVFYDDVNYITRGFINRNNVLSGNSSQRFTIPVLKASQNKKINEHLFSIDYKKTLLMIHNLYSKAPNFQLIYDLVESIITQDNRQVAKITSDSVIKVFDYLGIDKKTYFSSNLNFERTKIASTNLMSICNVLKEKKYCNAIGGRDLYNKTDFLKQGITLSFLEMTPVEYKQNKNEFVANLSMIDILMWNSKDEVIELLKQYKLV